MSDRPVAGEVGMGVRLSLRQITVLHAIVRGGSAAAAAEALHISQPAVSKLITGMEDELGYALFRRAGRGLEPSSEAISLMPYIERVLGEFDRLQRHAQSLGEGSSGSLTVAGNLTLITSVAADAIPAFRATHSDIKVELRILSAPLVLESVLACQADIGLTYGPFFHSQLSFETIGRWPAVCAFLKGHPLEAFDEVHPSNLVSYPLLTYAEDTPTGLAVRRLFENLNIGFSASMVLSNTPSVLQMVDSGLGIGLVDQFDYFADSFPRLVSRPLTPRVENTPIMFFPTERESVGPVTDLAALIRAAAQKMSRAWG